MVPATSRLPAAPKTQAVALPWPNGGQSALGAVGYGLLVQQNSAVPTPIGSTAKVITALAVLKQKPIPAGSQGPTITLSSQDVALFNSYYSQNGSVTQVAAGEQVSELQALQSILLPSSNNMADSLVIWAFGSVNNYLSYANRMVAQMGLKNTKVGDTNGFSDTTTSTAADLVRIGLAAMANPTIASVVSQSSAQVPVQGTVKNLNYLLGQDGIVGIKTGNTDKAGGCYLFAAKRTIQGRQLTLVGAILNQPSLASAINTTPAVLSVADSAFEFITPIHKNQVLALYHSPWDKNANLIASKDISMLTWKGAEVKISGQFESLKPSQVGTQAGNVSVSTLNQTVSSPMILAQSLPAPSLLWRILR